MFVLYILSTATLSYLFFSFLFRKFKIDNFTFNIFFLLKFVYLLLYIYSHYNNFGTDALAYYNKAENYNIGSLPISENLIYGINLFFRNFYNIKFESLNIATFFISFSSCLLLLSLIKDLDKFQKIAICITLLIPSLNFFTSGLNKDMLIFFSLSLYLYSLLNKKSYLLALSIILAFLVRPYVCFVILASYIICKVLFSIKEIIIDHKISLKFILIRIFFLILSILIIYFILDNLLGSFGKYFLKGNILAIVDNLQSHYSNTTLGIPVDTNISTRLIKYAFFPTIFDLVDFNIFFIILIIENTFLIFVFIYFILRFRFSDINNQYKFIAIVSFIMLYFVLALVTSNSGIAIRQKWMVLPFLLILFSKKLN